MSEGLVTPSGHATFEIVRKRSWVPEDLDARLRAYNPRTHFGDVVKACFRYLPQDLALELLGEMKIIIIGESTLVIDVRRANGEYENWGVVSHKVVTDAGVNAAIAAMGGSLGVWGTFNYHGLGTGANAESASDTALQTELTTQYVPDNTRATGVVSNPAANQYRTQGTVALDGPVTIQEHGVFSQAGSPGGTLLDRSLTGGQSLSAGEDLICTYTYQMNAGG